MHPRPEEHRKLTGVPGHHLEPGALAADVARHMCITSTEGREPGGHGEVHCEIVLSVSAAVVPCLNAVDLAPVDEVEE